MQGSKTIFVILVSVAPSGASQVKFQTGSPRARRNQRKRHAIPEWELAALKSKGTYVGGSSGAPENEMIPSPCSRILNISIEALTGSSHINLPEGLNNNCSPKASSLKTAPALWRWMTTVQGQGSGEEPSLSQASLGVNLQSRPLHDFLQHLGFCKVKQRKSKMNQVSRSQWFL